MKSEPVRLPAEWEPQGGVLISWPHEATDWAYMLDSVEACYVELAAAIARHAPLVVVAPDTERPRRLLRDVDARYPIVYFDCPTNDTWIRDYGVIVTLDADGRPVLNDFGFNAWGGKFPAELDDDVTRRMAEAGLLRGRYEDRRAFILEGGSIESDGRGTLMVTSDCLLTPTRNHGMSRDDIDAVLAGSLGARKVLWLDAGGIIGDDTDGHVDTLARLAPGGVILYATPAFGVDDPGQAALLERLRASLEGVTDADGEPYSLVGVPLPEPMYDPDDGSRLPATYLNYLVINDAVLLPTYGQAKPDILASQIVRVAYPGHTVETVDCSALVRQHGSLHCATMQVPASALPL